MSEGREKIDEEVAEEVGVGDRVVIEKRYWLNGRKQFVIDVWPADKGEVARE